jgi:hypothetical protein
MAPTRSSPGSNGGWTRNLDPAYIGQWTVSLEPHAGIQVVISLPQITYKLDGGLSTCPRVLIMDTELCIPIR